MTPMTIAGSSFLIPQNKVWKVLSKNYELKFSDYGDWSSTLLRGDVSDSLTLIFFLDDFLDQKEADEQDVKNLFSGFWKLLERRLKSSTAATVIAFASCNDTNTIRRARILGIKDHVHYWFLSQLEHLCVTFSQLYYIDLDKEFASVDGSKIFDSRNWYFAHCHLSNLGLAVTAKAIAQVLHRRDHTPSKVLVLDCDNTIWGGVIGEDGLSGLILGQDGLGQAFADFQSAAKKLAAEGVIIAIASKNNEEDVWNVFDSHESMQLRREDVVAWKINWNDKSQNIRQLAEELDLGLDSFVFWDDNPMERDRVSMTLPEVYTVDIPKNVTDWAKFLYTLSCFSRFNVTADDQNKAKQYSSRASFVRERSEVEDEKAYLKSIRLSPHRLRLNESNVSRAAQLCAKTNQFNLRTVRHTEADLQVQVEKNPDFLFLTSLEDIYGDHGIVGLVCLVPLSPQVILLDTLLMSCRVLGRHLEAWMLDEAIGVARNHGYQYLVGQFILSEKNMVAENFFTDHGFDTLDESHDDSRIFKDISSSLVGGKLFITSTHDFTIPFMDIYNDG
jgi:FkbH-like protein